MAGFEPAYPLVTERLRLRPFTLDDSAAAHALHSREDVVRYLHWEPLSPEAHVVENEWVKGRWDSEIVYAILDREWRALS